MYRFLIVSLLMLLPLSGIHAQRPDAPTYAEPGPYLIGVRDVIIEDDTRPLTASIWYPAAEPGDATSPIYRESLIQLDGRATRNAPPLAGDGPYPVVVFSHGSGGFRFQSLWLTEHLASYGFIVIAADHPNNTIFDSLQSDEFAANLSRSFIDRPLDVTAQLDYLEVLSTSDDPLAILIDMDRIAVSGHSFGGYTALQVAGAPLNIDQLNVFCSAQDDRDPSQLYTACFLQDEAEQVARAYGLDAVPSGDWGPERDERVDAVIAMAPWNSPIINEGAAPEIPALILIGTADDVTPAERDAYQTYADWPGPKSLVSFAHGGHYLFVDDCFDLAIDMGFFDSCSDDVWDMDRAHDLSNHFTTAFLLNTFKDPVTYETGFPGVEFQTDQPLARLETQVIAEYPHDTGAFTQGLLLYEGEFYESTGQYGESSLRRVDPASGEVRQRIDLDNSLFGEGLALVDDRLIQLTWQAGIALVYDRETFEQIDRFTYDGQGWGLCYDGTDLYMSDGSATITVRDPASFAVRRSFQVRLEDSLQANLNELECVGDMIYANVWQTDNIVRFDKEDGAIDAMIDASGLLTPEERTGANVLNGIAYNPASDTFYITGKYWPRLFEVVFAPNQNG